MKPAISGLGFRDRKGLLPKNYILGDQRGVRSCVPKPESLNRAFQTIPPFSSKSKARPSAAHRQAQSILARVRSLGIQGADIQRFESALGVEVPKQ